MTSSDPVNADHTGYVDLESLGADASAARAIEGMQEEAAAAPDRPQPRSTSPPPPSSTSTTPWCRAPRRCISVVGWPRATTSPIAM